jgi:GT2 family glycosyltransferase
VVVRKEVVEKVGLLDQNFLIYWEEIDWCKRILEAGYKIYYVPEAQIVHYWQVSMDKHGKEKKKGYFLTQCFIIIKNILDFFII